MKKLLLFMIIFLFFNNYIFAQDTVWNIKDSDFWTEVEEENQNFESEKNEKLDTFIELNLNEKDLEVDLIEAIQNGIEKSSEYKIAKYQKRYSDWEFRNKLSEFIPSFDYSFNLSNLKGEFLVGGILPRNIQETVYSSTITMTWDIFSSKRVFEIMQLKNQQKSKQHSMNYSQEQLVYKISVAYYELLAKKFELEIYKYNLFEAEEQLKYNSSIYQIGYGTKFDVLRAQTEVETAKANLQSAILSYKMAQSSFSNISAYPAFTNIKPKDKVIHKLDLVDENSTPEMLYSQALLLRNDIKAKEREVKALKAKKNKNFADIIPSVSLTWQNANVGTLSAGGRKNDTYSVVIKTPLGRNLGVNSFTQYKMDEANCLVAEAQLLQLKTSIQENITNNYFGSKANQEIINSKNNQIISTKEGLKQALARMKIGEATYLDVIEANRLKTQARIELIEAIKNYNKTQLKQMFDIGQITPFAIIEKYNISKNR